MLRQGQVTPPPAALHCRTMTLWMDEQASAVLRHLRPRIPTPPCRPLQGSVTPTRPFPPFRLARMRPRRPAQPTPPLAPCSGAKMQPSGQCDSASSMLPHPELQRERSPLVAPAPMSPRRRLRALLLAVRHGAKRGPCPSVGEPYRCSRCLAPVRLRRQLNALLMREDRVRGLRLCAGQERRPRCGQAVLSHARGAHEPRPSTQVRLRRLPDRRGRPQPQRSRFPLLGA